MLRSARATAAVLVLQGLLWAAAWHPGLASAADNPAPVAGHCAAGPETASQAPPAPADAGTCLLHCTTLAQALIQAVSAPVEPAAAALAVVFAAPEAISRDGLRAIGRTRAPPISSPLRTTGVLRL
jgi:hypothetical protein